MFTTNKTAYSHIEKAEPIEIKTTGYQSDSSSFSKTKFRSKHVTGWRFSIALSAVLSSVVLIINISLAGFSIKKYGKGDDGIQTLFAGSCSRAHTISTFLHLLINVLSTILLGASNYCMQCLCAPTRTEVDRAHRKKIWLDIGVPSTRNLKQISSKRMLLWLILGLSSLPLHLFYNSAVISSIGAIDYGIFEITQSALYGGTFSASNPLMNSSAINHLVDLYRGNKLERLENAACQRAYAQDFQTIRQNVLLVVDKITPQSNSDSPNGFLNIFPNASESSEWIDYNYQHSYIYGSCEYQWICQQYSTPNQLSYQCNEPGMFKRVQDNATWIPFGNQVQECFSEIIPEDCRVHTSIHIMGIVIVLNILKTLVLVYAAFGIKESPLLTIGDAIATFLANPDPNTKNMCLVTKPQLDKLQLDKQAKRTWRTKPQPFVPNIKRWYTAGSKLRWMICFPTYFLAVIFIGYFLHKGLTSVQRNSGESTNQIISRIGFGGVTSLNIVGWSQNMDPSAMGIVANSLVANTPQTVLSFLYFTYNGLFTAMTSAAEYSSYGIKRKGLRVSTRPIDAQRTTYFLQLPYRFSFPLLAFSALTHWLVSQAIFVIYIRWTPTPNYSSQNVLSCGWSPLALICLILVTAAMIGFLLAVGCRKLESNIPVAGSCSAAIAAACHQDDIDAMKKTVMWGVTSMDRGGILGHCSFSSREVEPPDEECVYA